MSINISVLYGLFSDYIKHYIINEFSDYNNLLIRDHVIYDVSNYAEITRDIASSWVGQGLLALGLGEDCVNVLVLTLDDGCVVLFVRGVMMPVLFCWSLDLVEAVLY